MGRGDDVRRISSKFSVPPLTAGNEARKHDHISERMRAALASAKSRGVKLADGSEIGWHNRAAADARAEVKAWRASRGYLAQFPVTLAEPS